MACCREFFGVSATGRRGEVSGINIDRFDESGKMVEEWASYDALGIMRQLGALREPGQEEPRAPAEGEREEEKGLEAGAEMATFDCETTVALFGGRDTLVNTTPSKCDILAERMRQKGIKPE